SVSGVEEVSCSASDAHYKVIQTFPFTSDMHRLTPLHTPARPPPATTNDLRTGPRMTSAQGHG
ncbi:hypothetical protein ACIP27_35685, partial [Streptomyces hydrogenans]